MTEPDRRNLEYVTDPIRDYAELPEALLAPRRTLRQWLQKRELTLLPGSTMSMGADDSNAQTLKTPITR